jgi:hypothetical protein
MTAQSFALLERLHGHVGWLALALLLHPVVTLGRRPHLARWTVRSAELAAALLASTFAAGWWLYGPYRARVKPGLLADAPRVAAAFESKEHLAFVCLCLAMAGAVTLRLLGHRPDARRLARSLLGAAWLTGVTAAAGG